MTAKVQKFSKSLAYTAVFANGILTVTTVTPHYLSSGDVVDLADQSGRYQASVAVLVTGANTFTTKMRLETFASGVVVMKSFRAGVTGRLIAELNRSTGAAAVIQSFVTGTGGATYDLELSLDGVHWVTAATIVHGAIDGDTQFQSISPAWAFISANITVIGAATKFEAMYSI